MKRSKILKIFFVANQLRGPLQFIVILQKHLRQARMKTTNCELLDTLKKVHKHKLIKTKLSIANLMHFFLSERIKISAPMPE